MWLSPDAYESKARAVALEHPHREHYIDLHTYLPAAKLQTTDVKELSPIRSSP